MRTRSQKERSHSTGKSERVECVFPSEGERWRCAAQLIVKYVSADSEVVADLMNETENICYYLYNLYNFNYYKLYITTKYYLYYKIICRYYLF